MKQSDRGEVSRCNGRRSRGPVTAAGKEKSRMNAVTHGLFAKAIPGGRMPVFADRREFTTAVQRMAADLGVATSLGRSLVESLAMDMLRLRHVRAMELALLDPGTGTDFELEAALRDRDSASCRRSDEENELLLKAYAEAEAALAAGGRPGLDGDALRLMTADLWRAMNEARLSLERDRQTLRELDDDVAAGADAGGLAESRALLLQAIATGEQDLRDTDKSHYLVGRESDVAAMLSGRKRIAPALMQAWEELLVRRRKALEFGLQQVMSADARIGKFRRRHLLASVDCLDRLNRLAEYENGIRRSITRTLAMIRDVEGASKDVIEVTD